jgi:glycosyltransferase involved in cell wall biosynthesis
VEFLIVGEGTGKIALEKKGEELKLKNLKFLEWQPSEMLPYSLAAADIAVVTLSRSNESNSIPSKFFNYLAVGAPILSIAPESSELVNLIDKYRVGKNFGNPHVNDIIDFIELLSDEKTHRGYSARSLKAANDFTNINAEIFIEKLNY